MVGFVGAWPELGRSILTWVDMTCGARIVMVSPSSVRPRDASPERADLCAKLPELDQLHTKPYLTALDFLCTAVFRTAHDGDRGWDMSLHGGWASALIEVTVGAFCPTPPHVLGTSAPSGFEIDGKGAMK